MTAQHSITIDVRIAWWCKPVLAFAAMLLFFGCPIDPVKVGAFIARRGCRMVVRNG